MMSPISHLLLFSLGAAEHLWLCASWFAGGDSEEEYNHGYLSHMAAGLENNFHLYCSD